MVVEKLYSIVCAYNDGKHTNVSKSPPEWSTTLKVGTLHYSENKFFIYKTANQMYIYERATESKCIEIY